MPVIKSNQVVGETIDQKLAALMLRKKMENDLLIKVLKNLTEPQTNTSNKGRSGSLTSNDKEQETNYY